MKKILTGSGKASKQDVADALADHVGNLEYASDDESDAVAVGVAWILKHKEENAYNEKDVERVHHQ